MIGLVCKFVLLKKAKVLMNVEPTNCSYDGRCYATTYCCQITGKLDMASECSIKVAFLSSHGIICTYNKEHIKLVVDGRRSLTKCKSNRNWTFFRKGKILVIL